MTNELAILILGVGSLVQMFLIHRLEKKVKDLQSQIYSLHRYNITRDFRS